jgi:hypothetical protein
MLELARPDLRGGCPAMGIPTAILAPDRSSGGRDGSVVSFSKRQNPSGHQTRGLTTRSVGGMRSIAIRRGLAASL